MKKYIFVGFIAALLLFVHYDSSAQRITLEGSLDEAVSLSQTGEKEKLVEAIKSGSFALESEANTRGNEMKEKLMGQAGVLKSLIPLAAEGTLKTDVLTKVVNTIKLLVGANQINNLLSEGKEGLLGNATSLAGSLNLLQSGKSALDTKQQGKLGDLIEAAAVTVKKLDGNDAGAKIAASSVKKTLGKIVELVKNSV
jgi:hypothetical protein